MVNDERVHAFLDDVECLVGVAAAAPARYLIALLGCGPERPVKVVVHAAISRGTLNLFD
jgi:hypothetical protein